DWFKIKVELVASHKSSLGSDQRGAFLALVFRVRTAESWDIVWPCLQIDAELARSVLLELAFSNQYGFEVGIGQLSESKLIDVYRVLAEHYPIQKDRPFQAGPQLNEPGRQDTLIPERVGEFRQEILRILGSRDSQAGCDALASLASEFEQSRPQIHW